MAAWSRATESRITLPVPHSSPNRFVEALVDRVASRSWDVLVPGTEASLLPISAAREALEPHVALGLPSHSVVVSSVDKLLLQRTAASLGLGPPTSVACADRSAAVAAAAELGFPVVVKPERSFRAASDDPAASLEQRTPVIAEDRAGLDAAVTLLGEPLTVQRFDSDARLVSCAGVRLPEGVVGFTVARYARTWPPDIGSAVLARTVEPPDGLRTGTEDILAQIGWQGIFELEFLEQADGRFGAIDLNPRPFGWLSLAVGAGANLPAIWCDYVLGRGTGRAADAAPGHSYRWEKGEVRYIARQVRRLDWRALAQVRPRRNVIHACFEAGDPAPLLAQSLESAGSVFGRTRLRAARSVFSRARRSSPGS
jgi:predicted ATP-grasp superfamily ATP-dependent carboligase